MSKIYTSRQIPGSLTAYCVRREVRSTIKLLAELSPSQPSLLHIGALGKLFPMLNSLILGHIAQSVTNNRVIAESSSRSTLKNNLHRSVFHNCSNHLELITIVLDFLFSCILHDVASNQFPV